MPEVLIIGAGLSGLIAARALHHSKISFQLIEARDRLGGRILSMDLPGNRYGHFDLGPSWFWPGMDPVLGNMVSRLGVESFPQYDAGDSLFQRGSGSVQRYPGLRQEPASMRMRGGTAALVTALARGLPSHSIRTNTRVTHMTLTARGVDVTTDSGSLSASHVLLAVPPRLVAARVTFDPPMPTPVIGLWRNTPTWMARHAKFVAIYDAPFWRQAGLSGTARSEIGPLVEIHDATAAEGLPALFGFVGISAEARARVGDAALSAAATEQLCKLFGPQAERPIAMLYKDWAADPLTATPEDLMAFDHPSPAHQPWVEGGWQRYLTLIGSETSSTAPGYLAGAHEAAERGTARLLARLALQQSAKETPCA